MDILIWNPTDAALDDFDTWGRPHPELWNERLIDLSEGQIHVAATAQDEARSAVASAVKSQTCLVAADPNSNTLLASEISSHGRKPYLPEGEALIACQAAKLALGWE